MPSLHQQANSADFTKSLSIPAKTNADIYLKSNNQRVRFTNVIDTAAIEFERALAARTRTRPYDYQNSLPIELNLLQRTEWLRALPRKNFRLLQMYGTDGQPVAQIVAHLSWPRGARFFGHASVPVLGSFAITHEDEIHCLRLLPDLLHQYDGQMKLRLQAYRFDPRDLGDFECLARRAGYKNVEPVAATRTLIYDLSPEPEVQLKRMSKSLRAKILHSNTREKLNVFVISDRSWIPAMREALHASFKRTNGGIADFDFEATLEVAQANPANALILGISFKNQPEQLLAYSTNIRHGAIMESTSAGSFHLPELRSLHFSYYLFWERMLWARSHGSTLMDMGGITDGGKSDPLAGISNFKRQFSKIELEIGREMEIEMAPARNLFFKAMLYASKRS